MLTAGCCCSKPSGLSESATAHCIAGLCRRSVASEQSTTGRGSGIAKYARGRLARAAESTAAAAGPAKQTAATLCLSLRPTEVETGRPIYNRGI